MLTKIIIILAALGFVFFLLKLALPRKTSPPTKSFRCAKCKTIEEYSPPTISAWSKGSKRIYCRCCRVGTGSSRG